MIGELFVQGRSIDEIVAHLRTMDVTISRSAMGRHTKSLAAMQERLAHSREMARALVSRFGEEPDSKINRLNIEMLHGIVLQIATATEEDEDGDTRPVTFTPEDAKFLAQALNQLANAQRIDQVRTLQLRKEMAAEAVKEVEKVAKTAGLTRETVAQIREAVLGVA